MLLIHCLKEMLKKNKIILTCFGDFYLQVISQALLQMYYWGYNFRIQISYALMRCFFYPVVP